MASINKAIRTAKKISKTMVKNSLDKGRKIPKKDKDGHKA